MDKGRKKTITRRFFVVMLSVMMTVTFIPTSLFAFATEPEVTSDDVQSDVQTEALQDEAVQDEAQDEDVQTEATEAVEEEAATETDEEQMEAFEQEVTSEKTPALSFTKELDEVIVDVETQEGAFDEDVSLEVVPIAEGTKAYKKAEKALAENEQAYSGMLAFDIHFENNKGKEIEPNGAVLVRMIAKKEALKDLAFDAFDVKSVQITHIGDNATEVVADTDQESEIEGTVDVEVGKKAVRTIEAEFEVENFSTFALTWGEEPNQQSSTIHYGYIDSNGNFAEFESEDMAPILDTSANNVSIANTFEGYSYRDAVYCAPGVEFEKGVDMLAELDKTATGTWQYIQPANDDAGTSEQHVNIEDGSDIYAVYYIPEESTPSGSGSTDVPSPTATKKVTVHDDGSATIQLDIIGQSVTEDESHYANVMIIFDATRSMNGDKWNNAKAAARTLVNTLTTGDNEKNSGKIDFSFISFGRAATITDWGNNAVTGTYGQWTKDESAVLARIDSLSMVTTSGTNWEAGMRAGVATLGNVPDNEPLYIIFLTDGDPNTYYTNTSSTNYDNSGTAAGYNNSATTSANRSMDEASTLASAGNLYGIYCFAGQTADTSSTSYTRLNGVITGQGQGGKKTIAATASTIENEFKTIAETIIELLGATNVSADDGIPQLASVSADVAGPSGGYEYYISNDGENYTTWEDAPGASFSDDNGVTWDLSSAGVVDEGKYYRIKFDVWPSQESLDLIANLNNGAVSYDDLDDDVKAQIIEKDTDPKQYTLKTNTHYNINYSFQGENYQDIITDYKQGELPLASELMTVKKAFAHSINAQDPFTSIIFYLKEDGKYYMEDGTTSETLTYTNEDGKEVKAVELPVNTDNNWENQIYIAPGFIRGGEVLETGHKYTLEEKVVVGNEYEYEFTPQTVRPMFTDGELTYLILEDKYNKPPQGATTYLIDGEEYYVASSNDGKLVGTNRKTAELDITKIVDGSAVDKTDGQLAEETFTYRVTLQIPDGMDPAGIVGYEYIYRPEQSNAFYLYGYHEYAGGEPAATAFPEDIARLGDNKYRSWNTLVYRDLVEWENIDGKIVSKRDADGNIIWKVPAEDGYHTISYDMTLKQNEVIRFTNLPSGTKYTIQEIYANKYPADNVGGDTAGRTPVEDPSNIADQGYTISNVQKTAGEVSQTAVADDTISGTIEDLDIRYYNQFTNALSAVDGEINVTKVLEGYKWADGDEEYTFTLTPENGAPAAEKSSVKISEDTENHTASFGTIRFIDEGTYSYTVKESAGSNQNIVYDDTEATITFTVENKNGKLAVTNIEGADSSNIESDPATATKTFTNRLNTYDVTVTKEFQGIPADKVPSGFTITPTVGGEEQDALTIADAAKSDDGLTYTWTIEGVAYGTEVSAEESGTDVTGYTLGEATIPEAITVTESGQRLDFVNPYTLNTVDIVVEKVWDDEDDKEGIRPDSVEINLLANGDVAGDPITLNAENNWKESWTDLPEYDGNDKIKYTVEEVKTEVITGENADGTYAIAISGNAKNGFTITNIHTPVETGTVFIDPPVQKVVKGSVPKKAETYTFKLEAVDSSYPMPAAANGNSSMTMNIKGAGTEEFGEIEFTEEGTYQYYVTEVAGSNEDCEYDETVYSVTAVVTEGEDGKLQVESTYYKYGDEEWNELDTATFKFVNTYNGNGTGTETGDNSHLLGGLIVLILAALGLAGVFFFRRREEN